MFKKATIEVSILQIVIPTAIAGFLAVCLLFSSVNAVVWSPKKIGLWQIEYSQLIAPQGWSFFTRSAREPNTIPFDSEGNSLSKLPTSQMNNSFGINREGRAQGIEIGLLTASIEKTSFNSCDSVNLYECLDIAKKSNINSIKISNPLARPSLCGEILLISAKPYAFEYRNYVESLFYGEGWVKIEVEC